MFGRKKLLNAERQEATRKEREKADNFVGRISIKDARSIGALK